MSPSKHLQTLVLKHTFYSHTVYSCSTSIHHCLLKPPIIVFGVWSEFSAVGIADKGSQYFLMCTHSYTPYYVCIYITQETETKSFTEMNLCLFPTWITLNGSLETCWLLLRLIKAWNTIWDVLPFTPCLILATNPSISQQIHYTDRAVISGHAPLPQQPKHVVIWTCHQELIVSFFARKHKSDVYILSVSDAFCTVREASRASTAVGHNQPWNRPFEVLRQHIIWR